MVAEERCGVWMRYKQAPCAQPAGHTGHHRPAEGLADPSTVGAAGGVCGKWMPRAQEHCARVPGHAAEHRTARALENHRQRKTERRVRHEIDPAAQARWGRTSRLRGYGMTQEIFTRLLDVQGGACGMCRQVFSEDSVIFVDHDHECCPDEKRSCGRCVRGLLCLRCNTGLGYVERVYDLARAYLDASGERARGRRYRGGLRGGGRADSLVAGACAADARHP